MYDYYDYYPNNELLCRVRIYNFYPMACFILLLCIVQIIIKMSSLNCVIKHSSEQSFAHSTTRYYKNDKDKLITRIEILIQKFT